MKEDSLNNPARIKRLNKTKGKFTLWIPPIIAFLLALILAFVTNKLAFLVIVIAFLWIIGYSVKIRGFRRIKEVLILKTVYASIAWGMLVFIATFMLSRNIVTSTWSVFLLVVINISINEIMYDIRDMGGDKKSGIHTFPVVLGLKKSKQILLALVVIEILLPIVMIYLNYLPLPIIFLPMLSVYTYYLIQLLDTKKSSNFLFNVLVGGEQILWPIAYLVVLLIIYR
jgi:4-hydroxybenzoate polyprenyltransferase